MKTNQKSQKGFTIIEVLIVLAIAALIMLIVFLAVPALQRNQRNTSRRSDVGRVGAAIQEVLTNNGGDPNLVTSAAVQAALGQLNHYAATAVTVGADATSATTNGATIDTVIIHQGGVCTSFGAGLGQGADSDGASTRNFAVVYMVEPAGNSSRTCIST